MNLRRSLPWLLVVGMFAAFGGAMLGRMLSQKSLPLQGGTWLPEARPLTDFSLTDLAGQPFGNARLQGHPSLLFFGFTFCPDVCPTTLATLRELQRDPPLPGLQVLFVTVDPERDTPAVLRDYLAAFDPRFVGLYAPQAGLEPLLRSLGALAVRQDLPGGGYTMDHSATLYLLDTHGRLAAVFTPPYLVAGLRGDLATVARSALL